MLEKSPSVSVIHVLKNRTFSLLWTSQMLTHIALNMALFIFGIMIYDMTKSNAAVSILYFVFGIPAAVAGAFSGVIVDRVNKRKLLIITTLLRAIIMWLLFIFQKELILVYFLIMLLSILSQFFVPAEAALIPKIVPKHLLLPANSLFVLSFYAALIGGFVLGGPFLSFLGIDSVIICLGFVFFIGALILFPLKTDAADTLVKSEFSGLGGAYQEIKMTLTLIFGHEMIKQAILLLVCAQAIVAIFATLGPGFIDQGLSLNVSDSSVLLLGPAAVGLIVGVLVIGQIGTRYRKRTLIEMGMFLSGILLVFLALAVQFHDHEILQKLFQNQFDFTFDSMQLPFIMICFLFLGFANSLIDVASNTVLQEWTPDHVRGKMYGILGSLISGVALVPVLISGILADLIGISNVIFFVGTILTASGLYFHVRRKM